MHPARSTLAVLGIVAVLTGCSGDPSAPSTSADDLTGTLTVYAAASLQDTFEELGELFEQEHPGVTVTFNFGASSTLAQQIDAGAPVDVLATANTSTMESVSGLTESPEVFARNSLQIVVPAGNPGGVTGLADFADPELTLALCAEDVPCGSAAIAAFEAAGITPVPDTYEKDVTATLTKAVLGEVDAALVYRTDVLSAGDAVQGIDFPEAGAARNDYPIAVLADAPQPEAARAFVDLVLSETGQQVLADAGFDGP
ncbi:molybdate ABC transporter substrate-binding protein [Cellulomonas denverensis]|uniref:Molybdate ABC transporter substrate-binding protein n=1 Tax=Cellulomonas denverensis TaxID=264297 RepID=A0A7X6KTE2_9CELL|nr:molybdate ABC transporter substrate-binding protein [Cellulomonas denverensis]NKY21658.1 molybdate ABC transporter substrate-binding protein [Cellulomonas denverensis]GIG25548.1 molybdate-binding protein [Cellulomonas denverensis]